MSTPRYRYLLCDLLTDQPLAVLPLTGVSFGRRVSRVADLQATLTAANKTQVALAKLVKAYAGRSALWVYRDDSLWWGGIPWIANPTQDARGAVTMAIQGATFDSYAHRRRLYADKTYTGVDQGVIIPDLWRTIQADTFGNIGVQALDQPTGVLRDRTYFAGDHTRVGQLIEDMGDVIDGPEHTIDVYLDGAGNRVKSLRLANRLGSADATMVFQRAAKGGGRVVSWGYTNDATDGTGTVFQTRGESGDGNTGSDKGPLLSAVVQRTDLLANGWPLLDVTVDHSDVTEQATLDGYAQALAQTNGGPLTQSAYTVEIADTGWSPNRVGDTVRIKLTDLWHDGVDLTVRPVGCTVTPPEKGSPETVQLLLSEDEA